MNLTTVPRKIAALEYTALRLPLTALHRGVSRLDANSQVRLSFETALGSLDAAVGKVLANDALTSRGTAMTRRVDVLHKAEILEEKATVRREQGNQELAAAKKAAERERIEADKRAQDEVRALLEQQASQKRAAEQQAQAQAQARVKAAEREAQLKIETAARDAKQTIASIEERTQARTAKPKAQLREAAALQHDAAQGRIQADRLAQLGQTEKASRKSR